MRCEDFDELIYLFWDGRIDERKKEKLEKHLSTCNKCKEKLALLESIEKGAQGIKIKEPSQEYWDTFSSRVRERIIAQKEESFSFKLKKVFENLFIFSPLKIRIAAGLVSIVFVFIVGKLYMDYRGKEILPSKIKMEETKKPIPFFQKELTAPIELKEKTKPKETTIPQGEKIEKKGMILPSQEESRPMEALSSEVEEKGEKMPAQVELQKMEISSERKVQKEEKPVSSPKELEKAPPSKITPKEGPKMEMPKSEDKTTSARAIPTGAGEEKVTQPEEKGINVESIPQKETTKTTTTKPAPLPLSQAIETASVKNYYVLEGEKVLQVKEEDTLLQEDVLRGIIASWNRYLEKNPKDSLANEGYLQVAIGYYLLSKLTQDESILLRGIELLEKYEQQVTDPKTKEELNKKLKQLKALKEK